jgi:hypothetical protein
MKFSPTFSAACAGLLLALVCQDGACASEKTVYRCAARESVAYQDVPCVPGIREDVVYIDRSAALEPEPDNRTAAARGARPARATPSLRDALARIRVGMTSQQMEALDPRLRNGRSRTLEANGRRHEWRYVADDCVVHLADGVVVSVFR